jgi:RHS repeat-associated protein
MIYDAQDRMVEQTRSSGHTEIVYGPYGKKLALMNGQSLVKAFVKLPGGPRAVYGSSGLAYYRHSDHLGSSRLATTPSRTMYYDVAYAPYGEDYNGSGTTPDLAFTDQNQDTAQGGWSTNLYDFSMREYRTAHGRWTKPDPAGLGAVDPTNPQSWNRYSYVLNSPLSLIDPRGLYCVWDDGSYDDDPDDGGDSQADCASNGGTWFDGSSPGANYSPNSSIANLAAVAQGLGLNELSQAAQQLLAALLQAGYSPNQIVSGIQQLLAQQRQQAKFQNAEESGFRVFVGGQIVGTGIGMVIGGFVAGGFTIATDTYPFAGQTIPSGIISGGIVGFVEALPYSAAGGLLDFAWNYWGN